MKAVLANMLDPVYIKQKEQYLSASAPVAVSLRAWLMSDGHFAVGHPEMSSKTELCKAIPKLSRGRD